MRLKPIVASMFVLTMGGTSLAYADNTNTQAQLDAMKANVAKLQAIVEQNNPGGFVQPDGWWNRISISGQANIDGIASTKSNWIGVSESAEGDITTTDSGRPASTQNPFAGKSSNQFAVDTANLYVDANASDYTRAHFDIAYQTSNNATHYYNVNQPTLNEAYAVLGNFNKYPFYLMAGRQNVQFGDYQVYPMVYPFTQLLSQTKATAATIGFIDAGTGIYASAYGFHGLNPNTAATNVARSRVEAFGAKLGIKNSFCNWGYGVSVDYLNNMANVNYVQTTGQIADLNPPQTYVGGGNFAGSAVDAGYSLSNAGYGNRVNGVAANIDLVGGPFDAKLRYAAALDHFSATVATGGVPRINNGVLQSTGAKPWAYGVDLGYGFLTMQHQSSVRVAYQQSGQAAGVGAEGLAQNRYEAQYNVNVSRFTDLGFDVYYDKDYGTSQGGTGSNATTGVLRLGVKFA